MLTVFYFDQELFSDDSLKNPLVNSTILDKWLKYGCLAICKNNKVDIKTAVESIPAKYKQMWVAAMTANDYKKSQ